jgi:hypothetical protein
MAELAYAINPYKGVRFDRFGLYGYSDINGSTWVPKSTKEIDNHAHFALTWDGLKVSGDDGIVTRIGRVKGKVVDVSNGNDVIFSIANDGKVTIGGTIVKIIKEESLGDKAIEI